MRSQTHNIAALLQHWRKKRSVSQLQLAVQAEVSARHISFIETGRTHPSRNMVMLLASVLDIPLRERNTLLLSAGYAPVYGSSDLSAPELQQVKKTLELIMSKQEPYPALVMNSNWDLLLVNQAATRLRERFCRDPQAVLADGPPNLLRLLFHPLGVRDSIGNWQEVAQATLARVHRQVQVEANQQLTHTLRQILQYPNVAADFRQLDLMVNPPLMIPVSFRLAEQTVNLFSTVTTLGSALDITLQDLHIESYYPADNVSESLILDLCGSVTRHSP